MLIQIHYTFVYGTCSKQQQDDIPLVLGSLSQDFVTELFGPYPAAILCGSHTAAGLWKYAKWSNEGSVWMLSVRMLSVWMLSVWMLWVHVLSIFFLNVSVGLALRAPRYLLRFGDWQAISQSEAGRGRGVFKGSRWLICPACFLAGVRIIVFAGGPFKRQEKQRKTAMK